MSNGVEWQVYTCYTLIMARRTLAAFRIEPDILKGLKAVKDRDGVPVSEQVRRALRQWLKSKRVTLRLSAARKRKGGKRKR